MDIKISLIIFWAISSAISGVLFIVAGYSIKPLLKLKDALSTLLFIFCLTNGFYELSFSAIILLANARMVGNNNIDLIILWLLSYVPARVAGIMLALLIGGEITSATLHEIAERIRKIFRLPHNG